MNVLYRMYVCMLVSALGGIRCYAQGEDDLAILKFRHDSNILYENQMGNAPEIAKIRKGISKYEDVIVTGNGHLRLVASIPKAERNNPQAINLAASRAANVRIYLRQQYKLLTKWCFTFYIDANDNSDNTVQVEYIAAPIPDDAPVDIYCTAPKSDLAVVSRVLAQYDSIPYIEGAVVKPDNPILTDRMDSIATNPVRSKAIGTMAKSSELLVAIYYRWDKHHLDSLYLSNPQQLATLDSLLTSATMQHMDTVTIVAFASPEGHPDYNRRLSSRRANTIRNYILSKYPQIDPHRVVTIARGENWEGLLKFVLNDSNLPLREKVLEIITSPKSDQQKQTELTELDSGKTYYRYILPNYYRYLRNGASVFIAYKPEPPALNNQPLPLLTPVGVELPLQLKPVPMQLDAKSIHYLFALRTNLLYDAVGALNIGIELPFGVRQSWSVMADIAYSYWRSPKNLYALQTLEYGAELRYWFPITQQRKSRNPNWAQPLKGFYIGGYGKYYQRYDVQFIDGYQGDGSWSAGLTAGYAIPLNSRLSLDLGIGAGWFSTSQYRHYHQPEYDKNGQYHLMWQETGAWGGLSLTKLRLSLVWLLQKQTSRKGGTVK